MGEEQVDLHDHINPTVFLWLKQWKRGDAEPNGRGYINIGQDEDMEAEDEHD